MGDAVPFNRWMVQPKVVIILMDGSPFHSEEDDTVTLSQADLTSLGMHSPTDCHFELLLRLH